MDITYTTRFQSVDINNWSGTEYFIARSLEKENSLSYISSFDDNVNLTTRIHNKLARMVKKKYLVNRSPSVCKGYAQQILRRLNKSTDIIFSPSTLPLAYLETNKPKVFYTDATFASMLGYYDWFSDLSSQSVKEGLALDRLALKTSSLAIYSSDWAAQSAINQLGASPDKVKVVPFGANLENEYSYSIVKDRILNRDKKVCKILFLGIDWVRKGGDLVLKTVEELNNRGLKTELHVLGIKDIDFSAYSFVVNHGFINKAEKNGQSKIEQILFDSHFLFVPSKAEAYGIVFCEASAFGVPSITTNTGGIPTIVQNNLNGMIFELSDNYDSYVEYIYTIFNDYSRYIALAESSFNEYITRLNWTVTGSTLTNYMKELL